MPLEKLTVVFERRKLTPEIAMEAIRKECAARGVPSDGFDLSGKTVDLPSVVSRLKKINRVTFNLTGHGFTFRLGTAANYDLDFLSIKLDAAQPLAWDDWAAELIPHRSFVMAWLASVEYQYWQNAEDPISYAKGRRSMEHLPKKSNGLPYPLEKTIVDISGNPGRRLLCDGYYEVVGNLMWLGAPFWKLTKADKLRVQQAPWLRVTTPAKDVLRLEASPECFTTAEGPSGDLQRRLRALLFPGSGGV